MLSFTAVDDVTDDPSQMDALLNDGTDQGISFEPDPDPGYDQVPLEDRFFPDPSIAGKHAGPRVTATVRKDIRGKVGLFLSLLGTAWATRDEPCGTILVESIPDRETPDGTVPGIASALADIFCDSPELVRWFTAGGGYMKWLNLAVAVQPVLTTLFHHHITHTISDDGDDPDYSRYATN